MIVSPIIIIGCARSGTTLLYRMLSAVPELWSIGGESKAIIERFHSPALHDWTSGALDASDLTEVSRAYMLRAFEKQSAPGTYWSRVYRLAASLSRLRGWKTLRPRANGGGGANAQGRLLHVARRGGQYVGGLHDFGREGRTIRLLEKTPENVLRLSFLQALFPDARIIYIHRQPEDNIASLMAGWTHSTLFPGYKTPLAVTIPGVERNRWAFTLIPGWQKLRDRPLPEVCARQWAICNDAVLDYAARPDALGMFRIGLAELVSGPESVLNDLETFLDLPSGSIDPPKVRVNALQSADSGSIGRKDLSRFEAIYIPTAHRLGYSMGSGESDGRSISS